MAIAPFFDRIYGAVGLHLGVSKRSLEHQLKAIRVGIMCGAEPSQDDRTIAEFTVNILSRLYPLLHISASPLDIEHLKEIAQSINPDIEFCDADRLSASIAIGNVECINAVYPFSSGWVAHLQHAYRRHDFQVRPENPYAASAAAAFACSEVFRRIFLKTSPERDFSLSLLDYSSFSGEGMVLENHSLGDVLFVGVGAVGNAALWVLSRDNNRTGHLILVDRETLELSNLQRYMLGAVRDVGRPKVELGEDAMQRSKIRVSKVPLHIQDFYPVPGWQQPETTCISVDNVEARRIAQALLPKVVVNGWTGDESLGTSWHRFSDDCACLACLYHPHTIGVSSIQQAAKAFGLTEERTTLLWITQQPLTDKERKAAAGKLGVKASVLDQWKGRPIGELYSDVICGAVPINLSSVGRVEVVPLAHQSALAGVLMAAELVKRTDPALGALSQKETLCTWENVLKGPSTTWNRPRPREVGCICGDSIYQSVYRSKWVSSA